LWNDHQFGYITKIEKKTKACLPTRTYKIQHKITHNPNVSFLEHKRNNTPKYNTKSHTIPMSVFRTQKEQHTMPCSYKSTLGHHILFPFPKEWCSAHPAEMSDVLLPHLWNKLLRKKQVALAGEALS
jgi:hypothetical protein